MHLAQASSGCRCCSLPSSDRCCPSIDRCCSLPSSDLREPRQTQSPSLSLITHGSSPSSSSPSSRSPLASSLTRSVFHSKLKTWLFGKSFHPQTFSFPTRLILGTLGPFNIIIMLNGWICLHGVLD